MYLLPLPLPLLSKGDDLVSLLSPHIQSQDIIVISSKAIATVEGAAIDLSLMEPSNEADTWSKKTGRSAGFMAAVLQENARLHGKVLGSCPGAILTEVRPDGLPSGVILTANAGLDESNIEKGFAIGWPRDPLHSAVQLRQRILQFVDSSLDPTNYQLPATSCSIAVIISDSCCIPRRIGVVAHALVCAGMHPLESMIGKQDLFGRDLRVTVEATADQLATAANMVMGNAAQGVPAVLIRDHGLDLSDWSGWIPGIEPQEDLFGGML